MDPNYFCAAPTRDQAKRIYWNDLKNLIPRVLIRKNGISETELTIKTVMNSTISVVGMDKPERIEGSPWDGGILDEYANMKAQAWGANIRPALADRHGWCDLIGVPEGRNHYYDVAEMAKAQMIELGDLSEWGFYHWKSSEVLSAADIESARRDTDELTFTQEYEGSFINFSGMAYYTYSDVNKARLEYNPKADLAFCFDFNVDPGVAVVCQEGILPNGLVGTMIIGEVYIPQNSNTPAVCRKLLEDWGKHEGYIYLYGDATGGQRRTSSTAGSDWDLVKELLGNHFTLARIKYYVPRANPSERARVNTVNSRILSSVGERRLFLDPNKAPYTSRDLEGVRLLEGGSGEIDKNSDKRLTHLCFAAGTMVELETGPCAIEKVPQFGKIRTWNGQFVPYENVGMTAKNKPIVACSISTGETVYCTYEHKWLTTKGWVCAKSLKNHDLLTWQSQLSQLPSKNLMSVSIPGMENTSSMEVGRKVLAFIKEYGSTITALFHQACVFTTSIKTSTIIKLKILNYSLLVTTSDFMTKLIPKENSLDFLVWKKLGCSPHSGTGVLKAMNGMFSTGMNSWKISQPELSLASVNSAVRISWAAKSSLECSVQINAKQQTDTIPGSMTKIATVQHAEQFFRQINIAKRRTVRVVEVNSSQSQDVYCLHVPNHGCFALENGAIVSNSDALGYYIYWKFSGGNSVALTRTFWG
jgi:hypothetical protein